MQLTTWRMGVSRAADTYREAGGNMRSVQGVKVGVIACAVMALVSLTRGQAQEGDGGRPHSVWVYPGPDGRLVYTPTESGDRIPDFSTCGYMGGGGPLPEAPVRAIVEPGAGDDGDRIQAAIDEVAALEPGPDGIRGAVLLRAGTYEVAARVEINASGVVLRGEGQGDDGTIIIATGTDERRGGLIRVSGEGSPREVQGTRTRVTEEYVPVGALAVTVEDASGFRAGDLIIVHRPSTAEWIAELGMDRIPPRRDGGRVVQWAPGAYDLRFERVVTAVEGNTLHLDAPLANSLDERWGGGYVYRYEYPGRISQVGVERLRAVSEFDGPEDEDHAWNCVVLHSLENAWVREVTAVHFAYSTVTVGRHARAVTVQDCSYLDPVSRITGARRYAFNLSGQLALVQRCFAERGRHDFVMHARVPGPNVFLDCLAEDARSDSGPHHRWATATLHDNVVVRGNALNVRNRGNSGTGHGWAGANMVFWNCEATTVTCQMPPTANNWAIGCTGAQRGDGHWDSHGAPVAPRSLYLAQLAERLGQAAVEAVTEPGQR